MILPLTQLPKKTLRETSKKIDQIDAELKQVIADMIETVEFVGGVGLAAPQVEKNIRLFVINYPRLPQVFINPRLKLLLKEGTVVDEEGCLSVPGKRGFAPRAKMVEIEYLDENGQKKSLTAEGFRARILQHETDHLEGKLYIDRIKDPKQIRSVPPARIVFFGTPTFGMIVLWHILGLCWATNDSVVAVVTSPDKPSGRGNNFTPSPVKELAQRFGVKVLEPKKLRDNPKFVSELKKLNPNLIVLAAYGKIIPQEILSIPSKGSLNVHPSLLPKYRGASPIQAALLNQEKETGVSIIKMVAEVDAGEILAQMKMGIKENDTSESLAVKLANMGGNLMRQVISLWIQAMIKPSPQNGQEATFTKILSKEDGYIDLKKPPKNLEARIKAFYPWPGVWTKYQGKILKFLPGGLVQLEGKKAVKLANFKAGHQDFPNFNV